MPYLNRQTPILFIATSALLAATLACNAATALVSAPTVTPAPTVTSAPAPTVLPLPTEAVNGLAGVQAATVQIISEGAEFLSSGSGLIYTPDGLILTNNHVIEGATILKVHIEGQADLLPARVVGKSPCDDLAVLKISTPGEYPSAKLGGEVAVGDPVYAVGYPLGDQVQSVTSGIISKTEANGETSFASIPRTLQTDVAVNPGNSGGPLITKEGQVIGVVYASQTAAQGTNFAIPMDYALTIVKQLEEGQNLHWLGLNAVPLTAEAAESYKVALEPGLFVLAVDSGSPAEEAGIQASDYLTAIEDLQVGADGTLKSYCGILRSHDTTDVLSVAAIRAQARCNGQFNGKALICQQVATSGGGAVSGDLIKVTDASGRMSTQAPAAWQQGNDVSYIVSAVDLDAWYASYPATQAGEATTTGFFLYQINQAEAKKANFPAFTTMDADYLQALFANGYMGGIPSNCQAVADQENKPYDDGRYTGVFNIRQCGTMGAYLQVYVYSPADPSYFVWYEAYAQSEAEIAMVGSALTNFFIGEPTTAAEAANWAVSFVYNFPAPFWSVGTHQYTWSAACASLPDANGTWTNSFQVSDSASLLSAPIYLRLGGLRTESLGSSTSLDTIHPAQSTVGIFSITDSTRSEIDEYLADCRISISWDGGSPQILDAQAPYQR